MNTLDVISVNIWQIVVSLLNLLILFLLVKKFLFGPVTRMLKKRQDTVDAKYSEADIALKNAQENEKELNKKLNDANITATKIISDATATAGVRSDEIVAEAKKTAENIVDRAKVNAELEMEKAKSSIKEEIVDVSAALTEKLLEREMNGKDHADFIDSFIDTLGNSDE